MECMARRLERRPETSPARTPTCLRQAVQAGEEAGREEALGEVGDDGCVTAAGVGRGLGDHGDEPVLACGVEEERLEEVELDDFLGDDEESLFFGERLFDREGADIDALGQEAVAHGLALVIAGHGETRMGWAARAARWRAMIAAPPS